MSEWKVTPNGNRWAVWCDEFIWEEFDTEEAAIVERRNAEAREALESARRISCGQ